MEGVFGDGGSIVGLSRAGQPHPLLTPLREPLTGRNAPKDPPGPLLKPREGVVVGGDWRGPRRAVAVPAETDSDWGSFTSQRDWNLTGELPDSKEPPFRASWLLQGMETSTAAVDNARFAFVGVGALNPDIHDLPRPVHAGRFPMHYAHMTDHDRDYYFRCKYNLPSADIGATSAPRSRIWSSSSSPPLPRLYGKRQWEDFGAAIESHRFRIRPSSVIPFTGYV